MGANEGVGLNHECTRMGAHEGVGVNREGTRMDTNEGAAAGGWRVCEFSCMQVAKVAWA